MRFGVNSSGSSAPSACPRTPSPLVFSSLHVTCTSPCAGHCEAAGRRNGFKRRCELALKSAVFEMLAVLTRKQLCSLQNYAAAAFVECCCGVAHPRLLATASVGKAARIESICLTVDNPQLHETLSCGKRFEAGELVRAHLRARTRVPLPCVALFLGRGREGGGGVRGSGVTCECARLPWQASAS
eukprot:3977858-Pleurochrysis_carterae.AAC.1